MTESAFQVCPFFHDHLRGDPSYDDCVVAYEDAKARMPTPAQKRTEHDIVTLAEQVLGLDARVTLLEGLYQGHEELIKLIADRVAPATAFPPDPVRYFKQHAGDLAEGLSDGTEGQDRTSYSDDQDRKSYSASGLEGERQDALRSRVLDTTVIQGHRYRVEYREAGKRVNREMVVDFLSETDSYWFFHGDEDFGTVQMRKEDTVRISEVPKTDKIMRPRPVRLKPSAGQRRAMGHTFTP